MALHCTECGFVNDEVANYCQRCGALLARAEGAGGVGG
ncbi:MAG TPA: zinc-ribbon domain-containing protein, partial [Solirubrobacteraceae bacterium]|nr:zinc-ribbon domain-containing protein [Solirubrobacteraceae bacterium]